MLMIGLEPSWIRLETLGLRVVVVVVGGALV